MEAALYSTENLRSLEIEYQNDLKRCIQEDEKYSSEDSSLWCSRCKKSVKTRRHCSITFDEWIILTK